MKLRFTLFSLLVLLLCTFAPMVNVDAQEVDYATLAVEALKTSNVYVYPNTPGTDYDTSAQLNAFLTPELNVVLVILPIEALNNTDLLTLARNIAKGTNYQKTIGLAVGDQLISYSQILPEGIATDLMERAKNVSNDKVTALVSFSRNVQLWNSRNPQPISTKTPEPTRTPKPTMQPIELPKVDTTSTSGKVSIGFITLFIIIFTVWLVIKFVPILMRRSKFSPASKSLTTNQDLLSEIEDVQVVKELSKAIKLGYGLLKIYRNSHKYTGIGEDVFPVMLQNMTLQLQALIDHESGEQPLQDQYDATIENLLNYDDLFKTLQKNDPNAVKLMAANYMSKNTMISHLGYMPTKSK